MKLSHHSSRSAKKILDQFAGPDDFTFSKTVVPVRLAMYGDEKLVSRSQAKRLIARLDRFKTVIFDFEGVAEIGQAFADEVFRVFAKSRPEIDVMVTKANSAVRRMVTRAQQHHQSAKN